MRGFKKRISIGNTTTVQRMDSSNVVAGVQQPNIKYPHRRKVVILLASAMIIALTVLGGWQYYSNNSRKPSVDIKRLNEISKRNSGKKEITSEDRAGSAKEISAFWKDAGDCTQADLTAKSNAMMLYSEDSKANKSKSLEILDSVIQLCGDKAQKSSAAKTLIMGESE